MLAAHSTQVLLTAVVDSLHHDKGIITQEVEIIFCTGNLAQVYEVWQSLETINKVQQLFPLTI